MNKILGFRKIWRKVEFKNSPRTYLNMGYYEGMPFEIIETANSLEGKVTTLREGIKLLKNSARKVNGRIGIVERNRKYLYGGIYFETSCGIPFAQRYVLLNYREAGWRDKLNL